jgi:hypothetical protein
MDIPESPTKKRGRPRKSDVPQPSFEYVPEQSLASRTLEDEFRTLSSANLERRNRRDKLREQSEKAKRPAEDEGIKVKRIRLIVPKAEAEEETEQPNYDDHLFNFDHLFQYNRVESHDAEALQKKAACAGLWGEYQNKLRELYFMEVHRSLLEYKEEEMQMMDTFKLLSVSSLFYCNSS